VSEKQSQTTTVSEPKWLKGERKMRGNASSYASHKTGAEQMSKTYYTVSSTKRPLHQPSSNSRRIRIYRHTRPCNQNAQRPQRIVKRTPVFPCKHNLSTQASTRTLKKYPTPPHKNTDHRRNLCNTVSCLHSSRTAT
jgi:hypothetical protein